MRQIFQLHIPTNDKHAVEQAKKDIGSCASEMGFNFAGTWSVKHVDEGSKRMYRVEAVFNT